jgi:hypothetical protein
VFQGHPALALLDGSSEIKRAGCPSIRLSFYCRPYERSELSVQMIRRGSPATIRAADAANTTGNTGPMFNAQATIAPTYQPVADQRTAAKARFFMDGVSRHDMCLPMELWYSTAGPIG